jgi:hypothetical protein
MRASDFSDSRKRRMPPESIRDLQARPPGYCRLQLSELPFASRCRARK